jgi:hypothetical protein
MDPQPELRRATYGLCKMYEVAAPAPAHRRARDLYAEGEKLHERGRHAEAAASFMKAAVALRVPARTSHDESFVINRRIAYASAVTEWLNANQPPQAARALAIAAKEDPELGDELAAWREALPSPPSCLAPKGGD